MSMYRSFSKPSHDNLRHPIAGSRRIGDPMFQYGGINVISTRWHSSRIIDSLCKRILINFHPVSLYKQMPLYSQGTAQQCHLNLLTLGFSASQLSIHAN